MAIKIVMNIFGNKEISTKTFCLLELKTKNEMANSQGLSSKISIFTCVFYSS